MPKSLILSVVIGIVLAEALGWSVFALWASGMYSMGAAPGAFLRTSFILAFAGLVLGLIAWALRGLFLGR